VAGRTVCGTPAGFAAMAHAYDYLFKVVLVGDSQVLLEACYQPAAVQCYVTKLFKSERHTNDFLQVGKTSVLSRYTDNVFKESYTATIGADFLVMQYNFSMIPMLPDH
jgi:hypothetical protein